MKAKIIGIASLALALFVAPAVVSAANSLTVDTDSPAGQVVFSGNCDGATEGQSIEIAVIQESVRTVLGNVAAEADGTFSSTLTLPATVMEGAATLEATCGEENTVTAEFTVVAESPEGGVEAGMGGTSGGMSSLVSMVLVGAVLLAGGVYAFARRKVANT